MRLVKELACSLSHGMVPCCSKRPVCQTLLACLLGWLKHVKVFFFFVHLFQFLHAVCLDAAEILPSMLLSDPKTATMITNTLEIQLQDSSTDAAVVKKAPKEDAPEGQLVEVKFPAKKPGKYNLQLICMSGLSVQAH